MFCCHKIKFINVHHLFMQKLTNIRTNNELLGVNVLLPNGTVCIYTFRKSKIKVF